MFRLALTRLAGAVPTLLLLVALAFMMMRAAPGGPLDSERVLPPEVLAQLEKTYHLDEPLWQQFGRYLGGVLQGDLGPSYQYADFSVNQLIAKGLPVSMQIGGSAMLLGVLLGCLAGCYAALRQNRFADHAVMTLAMTGLSAPVFVIAPLLILVFAVMLGWLPAGGWSQSGWKDMVLPVLALALPQVAIIARLMRGSMVEVLRQNYILAARAKGLAMREVVLRHALRPALMPVISYLGPAAAGVITGSVVVEQIFSVPGIGRYFVQAALNRDYTLVMGVVLFYGALIILFNFVVDLLYGVLDPRVRHS
jgi:oligopeptide transport system permease protein